MGTIENVVEKIDRNKEYNLSEIRSEGLFPWAKHIATIRSFILKDSKGPNLLKAEITGRGNARDYKIKGSRIIIMLARHGEFMMMRKYEEKHTQAKTNYSKL